MCRRNWGTLPKAEMPLDCPGIMGLRAALAYDAASEPLFQDKRMPDFRTG